MALRDVRSSEADCESYQATGSLGPRPQEKTLDKQFQSEMSRRTLGAWLVLPCILRCPPRIGRFCKSW